MPVPWSCITPRAKSCRVSAMGVESRPAASELQELISSPVRASQLKTREEQELWRLMQKAKGKPEQSQRKECFFEGKFGVVCQTPTR